jgi:hypothetical protein
MWRIGAGGPAGVADPYFQAVACRFDLSEGMAHIQSSGVVLLLVGVGLQPQRTKYLQPE